MNPLLSPFIDISSHSAATITHSLTHLLVIQPTSMDPHEDDDDMLERMEAEHWEFLRVQGGYSDEDIAQAKKRKRLSECVSVSQLMIQSKAWEFGE